MSTTPPQNPKPEQKDELPAGGVGSSAGIAGAPHRRGWRGLLLGSQPLPLDGIAEVDERDLKGEVDWSNYVDPPPPGASSKEGEPSDERLGICCSGGGIRAAAFCLGGLQALRTSGHFGKAHYLSAVSGGGYIAVAHATLLGLTRQKAAHLGLSDDETEELLQKPAPWSLDAPETENLRNHTNYLAPDPRATTWGVSVVLYGIVSRLLPFVALVVLLGTVYGCILVAFPLLHFGRGPQPVIVPDGIRNTALVGSGVPIAIAAVLLMIRQALERVPPPKPARRRSTTDALGAALAIAAEAIVASTVGLHIFQTDPSLTESFVVGLVAAAIGAIAFVLVRVLGPSRAKEGMATDQKSTDVGLHAILETWTVRLVTLSVAVGILLCLVPLLFTQVSDDWHHLVGALGGDMSLIVVLQQIAKRSRTALSSRWKRYVVLLASYVAGPLVVVVGFLLIAYVSAARGLQWSGFSTAMWVIAALAFLVIVSVFDDEVRAPLHMLYRERLSTAFVRYRVKIGPRVASQEPAWKDPIYLSAMAKHLDGMPKLVICASVNVADDVVPPGRFAGPFTFEADRCGGPLTGYVPTTTLEGAAGDSVLTLPGMMAIAAAAFSPLMGRTTRPGWRVLFALFDVRLGMWLPNPRWLAGVQTATHHDLERLRGPMERQLGRPPRFGTDGADTPRAFLRPGWSYALREALGLNSLRLPYVYVTDGGHFENLGLVELLRRGCTRIVCFDASEDASPPLTALGQAIALARDELGVVIDIDDNDVHDLWPGSANDPRDARLTTTMRAQGCITYPGGRKGVLIVVKNHLPEDAPLDVYAYAETNLKFPFDSTLDQFFDDERFDAYRALGQHGGERAAELLASLHQTAAASVVATSSVPTP